MQQKHKKVFAMRVLITSVITHLQDCGINDDSFVRSHHMVAELLRLAFGDKEDVNRSSAFL